MSEARTCPQCGAELRGNALEGLCPDCLGKLALGGTVAAGVPPAVEGGILPPGEGTEKPGALEPSPPGPRGETPGSTAGGTPAATRFGDYELLGEIARGGMGVVYKARQLSLNRTVALKMITAGQFASKEFVHRFRVEASAAAVLQHPNIVAVHEVGLVEGQHFFSMDYVAGKNLAQIVRDSPLPSMRAARYVQKIAEAIHYAHQSGILHRDLKPANVLLDQNDQPRITDFGLAKQLNVESSATLTGEVMGTPGYMPPEQASGNRGAVKAWSDVYSIGAILYSLLTGRAPFTAGSLEETLNQVLHQDPVSLRLLNPAVPRDLNTICLKCLEKEPAKRFATAQLLADELTRFLNHEPILAHPISTAGRAWRWCRRKPALAATGAVALLAVVIGFAGVSWQWLKSEGHRKNAERNAAQAQATVTRLEIDRAEMLFDTGQPAEALAYLARVVRREPTNRVAGERIISALAHRNFCVPLFRLEHKTNVTSAEFSPDGLRVLTASTDGKAQIWDGRTGQPLPGPFQHTGEITAAHFSPDGARVVTASLDNTARIWDAQTGQPITGPLRHESGVLCVDFSPDGQRVVTGSTNGAMRLWNAATGAPLATTATLEGTVDFVKFSPDGNWIALVSRGRRGRLLNAADGAELVSFDDAGMAFPTFSPDGTRLLTTPRAGLLDSFRKGFTPTNGIPMTLHHSGISRTRFSPDGQTLVTSSWDSTAKIWDAGTIQPVGEALRHGDTVNAIEFSPDGQQLVTGAKDHTARIWETRTGRPLSEPLRHDANVLSVQFSRDGQRILSRCEGRGVWVWEVRLGQPHTVLLEHPQPVRKAVFSPDGKRVATTTLSSELSASWSADEARLWDAQRGVLLSLPGVPATYDIQFSHDGSLLVAVHHAYVKNSQADGNTTLWESSTEKILGFPFLETNRAERVGFSPDGQLLVMSGYGNRVRVWRIETGSLVAEFPHQAGTYFAQFSPDGQWVVTISADATAHLWDWRTGKPLTEPLRHDGAVLWADVSADSQRVVTVSRDQKARIWEASSGKLLHILPHAGEPYNFNSVQFSPDGRLVVTAFGNAAQIWNSHTGQPITAPLKHDRRVNSVRFSPDGKRLVTACHDGTARIWDALTGHSVCEPLRHRGRVQYAEFSPDGRWVLTTSIDGSARTWEMPTLTSSVPPWLAEWAEAVAGQRIDERNASQSVPFDALGRLRQSLEQFPKGDETARWARWFFAETATRTISPGSSMTVAQWVQQRTDHYTSNSLRQAVLVAPTNGLAQGRLAFLTLTNEATPDARLVASLEWQSRRSLELSPDDADVWWARAQWCDHRGMMAQALDEMDRATGPILANGNFWNTKGQMLGKLNRLDEAFMAFTRAIDLGGSRTNVGSLFTVARLNRSRMLRRLNRWPEAEADNLLALDIPARDPEVSSRLVNLSVFYNESLHEPIRGGGTESTFDLAPGRRRLAGVDFDVRGVVQLWGSDFILRYSALPAEANPVVWPTEASPIKVGGKCQTLHVLHATRYGEKDGVVIGKYVVHYSDGQHYEIPIVYGEDIRDWWFATPENRQATKATVAWTGRNLRGVAIGLFKSSWPNPRPEVLIESIDFVSSRTRCGPFLIAVTLEP